MDDMVSNGEAYSNLSVLNLQKAFMDASRNGNLEILCQLLKHEELDVNSRDEFGETALIAASEEGHCHVVCELLKHGTIDVNARDVCGHTALIVASGTGHLDVVCELLNHDNVDVNAACCKHYRYSSWFLTEANSRNRQSRTALLWAIKYEYYDVVDELLQHEEINVNVQDKLGYTILMWTCLLGRLNAVSMLLKHDNVDVNIKNKAGSTALDIARNCEMFDIVQCLEEYTNVCFCVAARQRREE